MSREVSPAGSFHPGLPSCCCVHLMISLQVASVIGKEWQRLLVGHERKETIFGGDCLLSRSSFPFLEWWEVAPHPPIWRCWMPSAADRRSPLFPPAPRIGLWVSCLPPRHQRPGRAICHICHGKISWQNFLHRSPEVGPKPCSKMVLPHQMETPHFWGCEVSDGFVQRRKGRTLDHFDHYFSFPVFSAGNIFPRQYSSPLPFFLMIGSFGNCCD